MFLKIKINSSTKQFLFLYFSVRALPVVLDHEKYYSEILQHASYLKLIWVISVGND